MADLSTMFNQLGPAGGSILAGVQMGNEANQQQSEQAMRQAQMDKIIQDTAHAKEMNPLELQAKQQTITANDLAAKTAQGEYQQKALNEMIPKLEAVPEASRHAAFIQMAHDANLPMDQADLQHYAGMDAKELIPHLKHAHEWAVTQTDKYRQAMDQQESQNKAHIKGAEIAAKASMYAADQRANALAAKAKGISTIEDQVRSGKMTAEKAAVSLYGAAQFEQDPTAKAQYESMAQQYEKFAMNQRNAQNQGKVDVGAATQLPTQSITPALGNGPMGTATNPIVLK